MERLQQLPAAVANQEKFLSIFIFFSVTILILFSNFNPKQVASPSLRAWPRAIYNPDINAVVIDTQQTELLRQQAISKVQRFIRRITALANTEGISISFQRHHQCFGPPGN